MKFPKVNYLTDKKVKQLKAEIELKRQLKDAFQEVGQIQRGEKKAITLEEFLNEI